MAKTKLEKQTIAEAEAKAMDEITEEVAPMMVEETVVTPSQTSGPSYEELIAIIQGLTQKVQALEEGKATPTANDGLVDILTALTNRKSDREVSIVHNCELNGNLTTHIELSNAVIDFSHVGETRLLSWQQFEECASKYRSFFDRKVIMLGPDYKEVALQYNLPCLEGRNHALTQNDIKNITKLSVPQLEAYIESLTSEDKDTLFSYWLGKCYIREKGFYDRHKMDTLNRLSEGMFDNILLVMNGDRNASSAEKK